MSRAKSTFWRDLAGASSAQVGDDMPKATRHTMSKRVTMDTPKIISNDDSISLCKWNQGLVSDAPRPAPLKALGLPSLGYATPMVSVIHQPLPRFSGKMRGC
jgi:hypothetical protein